MCSGAQRPGNHSIYSNPGSLTFKREEGWGPSPVGSSPTLSLYPPEVVITTVEEPVTCQAQCSVLYQDVSSQPSKVSISMKEKFGYLNISLKKQLGKI